MTPFSRIINIFLNEIQNRDFALISNADLQVYFDDLVISASADFIYCKKDLNEVVITDVTTQAKSFKSDLTMIECNLLAKYVLVRYLNREIYNQNLLRQDVGDKDFKLSSNWQTLNSLMKLKDSTFIDIERMKFDYQYYGLKAENLM